MEDEKKHHLVQQMNLHQNDNFVNWITQASWQLVSQSDEIMICSFKNFKVLYVLHCMVAWIVMEFNEGIIPIYSQAFII